MTKIQVDSLGRAIMLGNNALVASSGSGCFPSGTYETLTLGASGATYTAPADGWYLFRVSRDSQGYMSGDITLTNVTKSNFEVTDGFSAQADSLCSHIIANAGDTIQVTYYVPYGISSFRFYYTIDSAPAQS